MYHCSAIPNKSMRMFIIGHKQTGKLSVLNALCNKRKRDSMVGNPVPQPGL